MRSTSFERFAGACAVAVAAGGLLYSAAFFIYLKSGSKAAAELSAGLLLLGGLVATTVMVAVYGRLRQVEPAFALWALLLGATGALGSAIHGGHDLANFIHPPATPETINAVDPRGLLTFGLTGLALLVVGWLIVRGQEFPRRLGQLAVVAGGLLVLVYAGRLTIFNPKNPALVAVAVLSGFAANPALFVWLGRELRRGGRVDSA